MKDERKTKKQLIAELEGLRGEMSEVRRQLPAGDDASVVARQLAAERVRAEALAMRSSNDLLKVAGTFFQAMRELGVETPVFNINFIDEDADRVISYSGSLHLKEYGISWTSPELIEFSGDIIVDVRKKVLSQWWWDSAGSEHWRNQKVHTFTVNQTRERFEAYLERIGGTPPTSLEPFVGEFIITNVPFKYGVVGFRLREHNDEYVTVVQELAEALSLGYLRFLDFQQLEEQAEQAQRERAVERVRAEAMGMRSSDDLHKVIGVMFEQMTGLGMQIVLASVIFLDKEQKRITQYWAMENPRRYGISWNSPDMKEISPQVVTASSVGSIVDDSSLEGIEAKLNKGEQNPEQLQVDLDRAMRILRKDFLLDDLPPYTADSYNLTTASFSYGTVGVRGAELNESHRLLLQQLTEALSFGYLRFLDFQKVDEAQKKLIDELEEELQTAHHLQMGLMPTESPQVEGFDIAGRCIPFNHVGGDFFQYFQQDDKLSICMADVTGHAMEAAVPVMMFSGVLKTEMQYGHVIDQLFDSLNRTMHDSLDSRTYVCFCMGELDVTTLTLRLANAACPYPLHFHAATGEVEEMQIEAYPLGVRDGTAYTAIETVLEPGDRIVFCSDGIIEMGNDREEIFGFERTAETVRRGCADGLSAEGLSDRVMEAVRVFAGEVAAEDDMTCVVLKVAGQG